MHASKIIIFTLRRSTYDMRSRRITTARSKFNT